MVVYPQLESGEKRKQKENGPVQLSREGKTFPLQLTKNKDERFQKAESQVGAHLGHSFLDTVQDGRQGPLT